MTLRDAGPNYRCITYGNGTFVELPHNWRQHVPEGPIRDAIQRLVDRHPQDDAIYAEGLAELTDEHRLAKHGCLIPIKEWDREPVA